MNFVIYFILMFAGIICYVNGSFRKDYEIRRNWRIVGIILYLGSGLASLSSLVLLISCFFGFVWILQTRYLYGIEKARQEHKG